MQDPNNLIDFAFVYVTNSLEHDYYKWRITSLVFGDDREQHRSEPFMLSSDGAVIYPPDNYELPEYRPRDASFENEEDNLAIQFMDRSRLGYTAMAPSTYAAIFSVLESLTVYVGQSNENDSIFDAMVFCMDNSENSVQLASIVADSLSHGQPDADSFTARLYLISDLLHNSTLASATHCYWTFRKYFELLLPASLDAAFARLVSLSVADRRSVAHAVDRVCDVRLSDQGLAKTSTLRCAVRHRTVGSHGNADGKNQG